MNEMFEEFQKSFFILNKHLTVMTYPPAATGVYFVQSYYGGCDSSNMHGCSAPWTKPYSNRGGMRSPQNRVDIICVSHRSLEVDSQ